MFTTQFWMSVALVVLCIALVVYITYSLLQKRSGWTGQVYAVLGPKHPEERVLLDPDLKGTATAPSNKAWLLGFELKPAITGQMPLIRRISIVTQGASRPEQILMYQTDRQEDDIVRIYIGEEGLNLSELEADQDVTLLLDRAPTKRNCFFRIEGPPDSKKKKHTDQRSRAVGE